ncbi:MAG: exodeoxyribonuclease VII small subunit [Oscillospiraceae bacterium]|nr:exodeoxyribonuclease VII small subunit [Oscillospiraceae bacterium]
MKLNDYTFEDAMNRLEELTAMLSAPSVTLAESVELFREAAELKKHCEALLKNASLQVEDIQKEAQL